MELKKKNEEDGMGEVALLRGEEKDGTEQEGIFVQGRGS